MLSAGGRDAVRGSSFELGDNLSRSPTTQCRRRCASAPPDQVLGSPCPRSARAGGLVISAPGAEPPETPRCGNLRWVGACAPVPPALRAGTRTRTPHPHPAL